MGGFFVTASMSAVCESHRTIAIVLDAAHFLLKSYAFLFHDTPNSKHRQL